MSDNELKQLLIQIANGDLVEGACVYDHPCSVAVRRIEELTRVIINASKANPLSKTLNDAIEEIKDDRDS